MNQPRKGPRFFLGLDPGRQTGWAVWDAAREVFVEILTADFWKAYAMVQTYRPAHCCIVIEMPSGATYDHDLDQTPDKARRREKVSRNVGSVQREAQLLAEGLDRLGYTVRRIRPRQSKLGARAFRRLTSYAGRTSQHGRDAGMLVFGLRRTPPVVEPTKGDLSLSLYAPPTG